MWILIAASATRILLPHLMNCLKSFPHCKAIPSQYIVFNRDDLQRCKDFLDIYLYQRLIMDYSANYTERIK